MDLNETTVIINEATDATHLLQNEFNTLINEIPSPKELKVIEVNSTFINVDELIDINSTVPIIECNSSISPIADLNKSLIVGNEFIDLNSTITLTDLNNSIKSSCKETNQSIILNGLNINLDENNTISDNGCTDANLGTSAEGLIIFKTRIRPHCEISGEKFAKQYMQEDWDDIYHDKEFKMEVLKACPQVEKRYKDSWTPHLYQFTLEYASDSDAIPEC
jgi:hypothetical protein